MGFNLFNFATDLQMNFNKNATFIYSAWNDAKIHDENGKKKHTIVSRLTVVSTTTKRNEKKKLTMAAATERGKAKKKKKKKKKFAFKAVAVV